MKKLLLVLLIIVIILLSALAVAVGLSGLDHADIQPSSWVASNEVYGLYNLHTHEYNLVIQNVPSQITIMSADPTTHSMLPVISDNSKVLILELENKSQINVGDIIGFNYDIYMVSHRVIKKGFDSQGLYFVTKGDHNLRDDMSFCGKVRPSQIKGVVIGIIY